MTVILEIIYGAIALAAIFGLFWAVGKLIDPNAHDPIFAGMSITLMIAIIGLVCWMLGVLITGNTIIHK